MEKEFSNVDSSAILGEFPTCGQDWANHIAGFYTADTQLKVVLEMDGRIQADKMIKAVRQSIDVESILRCYLQETDRDPIWKRFEHIDDMKWCLVEECKDKDLALKKFFSSLLSPSSRQLQAYIFQTNINDILCLTFNHSCTDVSGIKGYLHILSNIYRQLCSNIDYYPELKNNTNRSIDQIFQNLGITDLKKAWNSKQDNSKANWAFPFTNEGRHKQLVSIRKILKDEFEEILSYIKSNNATVNDFMMTAYYRTLYSLIKPKTLEPKEITTTVDLRRYLHSHNTAAICSNMSVKINSVLDWIEGESFTTTLKRVSTMMKKLKQDNPGINSAIAMELIRDMGYKNVKSFFGNTSKLAVKSRKSSPLLTNMGVIADYPFCIGETAVKDAYIVSPAGYAPNFILGFSSYNNNLTMTVHYFEPETSSKDVDSFFDLLINEIRVFQLSS